MEFSLDYLLDNVLYDLISDGIKYHGDIDYISQHLGDSEVNDLHISPTQGTTLQAFVNEYLEVLKTEPTLTIEAFYNRKAI